MSKSENLNELFKEFPYLEKFVKDHLFITMEEMDEIRTSDVIEVDNDKINVLLIEKILGDDDYYEYTIKYFKGEIDSFVITYVIGGDFGYSIFIDRVSLISAIMIALDKHMIELTDKEYQRYKKLEKFISYDKFKNQYKKKVCNVNIDGNEYSIKVEDMIELLELPSEKLIDIIKKNDKLYGIPKECFIYALLEYFTNEHITKMYVISKTTFNNLKLIRSNKLLDIFALNKHLKTNDSLYKQVVINDELRREIFEYMPDNLSTLEKAIYIYIKMCKVLTYDDEYYAVNQRGPATIKHKSIEHLSSITPSNNKVVCFEFNLMYTVFLSELGVNFESNYKGLIDESYGDGHANVGFRIGKYIISADSVRSILHGDMMQSKYNQPLQGLRICNSNEETQKEFREAMSKIYRLIAMQEKSIAENQRIEYVPDLEELIEEYKGVTDSIKEISLSEKISILLYKISTNKTIGIDALSYLLQLRKVIFNNLERSQNIAISVVRDNINVTEDRIAVASAIIAISVEGFHKNEDDIVYYYYNPNYGLVKMAKDEIEDRFRKGEFEYIEKDNPLIPAIDYMRGEKI